MNRKKKIPVIIIGFLFTILIILILLILPSPNEKNKVDKMVLKKDKPSKKTVHVLSLLVWENYTPEKFVKEFEIEIEEKYGKKVKLKINYAASSDDFFDPIRNKSVDLVTLTHDEIKDKKFDYIKKKLVIPFDLKNIPNHKNIIADIKNADYHSSNGKLYGIPVANGPYGLAYNTEHFKDPPESWKVFWEPEYKNKYLIGKGQYIYNINITALIMGYTKEDISNYDKLNNLEFKSKLNKLTINAAGFWIGVDKPEDLLGMSCAASWSDSLSGLKRKGEIWKMASPLEGTLWWIDDYILTAALSNRPFMKKVAELWVNKVLSNEFQIDHILREVQIYPVITKINSKLTDKEISKIKPESYINFMSSHILRNAHSQRNRNGLKLLWNEALKAREQNRKR